MQDVRHGVAADSTEGRMTLEPTFTVPEIAVMLKLTRQTVQRMFGDEPGVILLGRPERMHKRRYRILRVPKHVLERVLLRHTKC